MTQSNTEIKKSFKPVPDVACLKYKGTPDNPDIKIFVSNRIDLDSEQIDNSLFIPVRCGAVFDSRKNIEILGDDTGDNISDKRMCYGELTVLYWAWKNVDADYYGIQHYRRYFNFSNSIKKEDIYGHVCRSFIKNKTIEEFLLNDQHAITEIVKGNDIVISEGWDCSRAGFNNLKEQWNSVDYLRNEDLLLLDKVISELYPEYSVVLHKYFNEKIFYPCCMTIMKRNYFEEFCSFLFSVLFEYESRLDFTNYSQDRLRILGHIGERLVGVFLLKQKELHENLECTELQRVMFWKPQKFSKPFPIWEHEIPVVFACSDYYFPYLSVTLKSVLENSSKTEKYDLIILHKDITSQHQQLLKQIFSNAQNFSLRFINIESIVSTYNLKPFLHVSVETYYRLLSFDIFSNYDKIIYLDSDVIVLHDLAELFQWVDLNNSFVAAVKDHDFIGEYSINFQGIKKYIDTELKIIDPYKYFNGGVIVFNIKNINKSFKTDELIKIAEGKLFRFGDQDVMNLCFQGKTEIIDSRWNVLIDCFNFREEQLIRKGPVWSFDEYKNSKKSPYIVHYAGGDKPWENPECDFGNYYWHYARMLPAIYELNIKRMSLACVSFHNYKNQRLSFIKRLLRKIFPKGTKQRALAEKLFSKKS